MDRLTVNLNGDFFTTVAQPEDLPQLAAHAGVDVADLSIPAQELEAFVANRRRQALRRDIEPVAGDTPSIQGTIADNVGFLLDHIGRFAAAVTDAQDLAAVKAAAQPLADALAPLVAGVDSGDVVFTHQVKGVAQIITDGCDRATAVSACLVAHSEE